MRGWLTETLTPLRRTRCGNISVIVRQCDPSFRPPGWKGQLWTPAVCHDRQLRQMEWLWQFWRFFSCGWLGLVLHGLSFIRLLVYVAYVNLAWATGFREAPPTGSFWLADPCIAKMANRWNVCRSLVRKISILGQRWQIWLGSLLWSPVLAHSDTSRLFFLQLSCIQPAISASSPRACFDKVRRVRVLARPVYNIPRCIGHFR